jgi:SLOG in TRPM, prokaryote
MNKPATITFPNAQTAAIVQLQRSESLLQTLNALAIPHPRPTLVLVGGASQLGEPEFQQVRSLFTEVLVPLAEKWRAVVVDGGTDAGVMRLMGQARAAANATFALVGVCPTDLVITPMQKPLQDAVPLEPNHTHFVMVQGDRWGDESETLAKVATAIAGGMPSVTVLINGGEITWQDAKANVDEGRSLIVVEGTGRTADILAAALDQAAQGEAGQDERAVALLASNLVRKVSLAAGMGALTRIIEGLFAAGE